MNRREFITLLGAAAAWPLAARAQQGERVRRIGVLMPLAADDPEAPKRIGALIKTLSELGWSIGRNIQVEYRFAGGDPDQIRKYAAEFAAAAPDVILADGGSTLGPMLRATRTVPIVFAVAADPVGAGFVESLARPGGNATGFLQFEYGISAKWLELLREIAPRLTRAGVLRDTDILAGVGQFGAIQAVAPSLGVEVVPIGLRDADEIERGVAALARASNGGLIVTASAMAIVRRETIVALADRHKLPAVYFQRPFTTAGGLISYGTDSIGSRPATSTASSRARSQPTCPCRRRPSTSW